MAEATAAENAASLVAFAERAAKSILKVWTSLWMMREEADEFVEEEGELAAGLLPPLPEEEGGDPPEAGLLLLPDEGDDEGGEPELGADEELPLPEPDPATVLIVTPLAA